MSKELWIASYEELMAEFEEQGMDPDAASEKAADMAGEHMMNRLADKADYIRKRQKEGFGR